MLGGITGVACGWSFACIVQWFRSTDFLNIIWVLPYRLTAREVLTSHEVLEECSKVNVIVLKIHFVCNLDHRCYQRCL
jgi:hypothetical protein